MIKPKSNWASLAGLLLTALELALTRIALIFCEQKSSKKKKN